MKMVDHPAITAFTKFAVAVEAIDPRGRVCRVYVVVSCVADRIQFTVPTVFADEHPDHKYVRCIASQRFENSIFAAE